MTNGYMSFGHTFRVHGMCAGFEKQESPADACITRDSAAT